VTFKSVGPGGADVYSVKFEKGALEYRIWLSPDGKVDSANFHPEWSPPAGSVESQPTPE
jgi:hypothetical protein